MSSWPGLARLRFLVAAVLAAVLTSLAAGADTQPSRRVEFSETELGPGPIRPIVPVVSPDKRHIAFGVQTRDGVVVCLDGKAGPTVEALYNPVVFSPDSKRLAYVARNGGVQFIVLDGKAQDGRGDVVQIDLEVRQIGPQIHRLAASKEKGTFVPGGRTLVFSPDSKRLAYVVSRLGRFRVVVDDQIGEAFDTFRGLVPQFSSDGQHVAYVGVKGKAEQFVVDGQAGKAITLASVSQFNFVPGSDRLAYVATVNNKITVVANGSPGPLYDAADGPTFSADGKRMAYIARKDGKQFVVVDGQPGPQYDAIGRWDAVFAPVGNRMAYVAKKSKSSCMVLDGKEGAEYDEVAEPIFSPDGRHLAYAAEKDGKWVVVLDGQAGQAYDGIAENRPIFSPDASRLAYVVNTGAEQGKKAPSTRRGRKPAGKQAVVLDGKFSGDHDGVDATGPVFSPDGTHVAYAFRTGKTWQIMLDGKAGPEYEGVGKDTEVFGPGVPIRMDLGTGDLIPQGQVRQGQLGEGGLIFSRDGRHVAHLARKGDRKVLVVDGQAGTEYEDVHCGAALADDSAGFEALAQRKGVLYRVICRP